MAARANSGTPSRPKKKGKAAGVDGHAVMAAAKAKAAGNKGKGATVEQVNLSNFRPPGEADGILYDKHAGLIMRQKAIVDKHAEALKTERGTYAELFLSAKEAGVPKARLDALKKTLKLKERDPGEVLAERREMAWQAERLKLPVVQLGFFEGVKLAPSLEEWGLMGEADARNGNPPNPPGKPGSPEHAEYLGGHKKIQSKMAGSTFGDSKGTAPDSKVTKLDTAKKTGTGAGAPSE